MEIQVHTNTENLHRIEENFETKMPEVLDSIGVYLIGSIDMNFEKEGRPEKWKDNEKSTKEQKTGGNILVESGMLRSGTGHEIDIEEGTVYIGVGGPAAAYGPIQNFGGEAGKDGNVEIPARPYAMAQEDDMEFIGELIREDLFNG